MVGEFPELQGVMGGYYALHDGEDPRVADAIADHYKPQGPNDTCPSALISVIVALTDKLDSLAAFFAIDEKPTGSRDPFALRRAALGIIRIILENELRLPILDCFQSAALPFADDPIRVAHDLFNFAAERLVVELRQRGMRYDIVETSLRSGDLSILPDYRTVDRLEQDFMRLERRARALEQFVQSTDGANLLIAYRRAGNIVEIEEARDKRRFDQPVRPELLQLNAEMNLLSDLNHVGPEASAYLRQEQFPEAIAALATLRRPVDEFFDKVTVNAPEREVRENRLRLLSRIRSVMNQVADFSQIEG
jgi:glycyl-tRNA synthetase beta chain